MSEARVVPIAEREEPSARLLSHEAEALRRRFRRLALDVHDGPMQSLIAAGYDLRDLQQRSPNGGDTISDRLGGIAAELADAERGLRHLILSLERGAESERVAFEDIVAIEVERFRRLRPISVAQTITPDALPDSHSQEIAIRSVVRETLSNIAKHATADMVVIRLETNTADIRLEVRDDGQGFDPTAVPDGCIGLASMRERLLFLNGHLTVDSRPGGPTIVSATLPRWREGSDLE
jgi:signal transduction histidine kinase